MKQFVEHDDWFDNHALLCSLHLSTIPLKILIRLIELFSLPTGEAYSGNVTLSNAFIGLLALAPIGLQLFPPA